jgi:hypothetical protein
MFQKAPKIDERKKMIGFTESERKLMDRIKDR